MFLPPIFLILDKICSLKNEVKFLLQKEKLCEL